MPILLNESNFEEKVLRQKGEVIVDFYADWCQPCSMMAPVLESFEQSNASVTVAKVNVDDDTPLAIKYGIRSIPAILHFRDGELIHTVIGYHTEAELKSALEIN